MLPRYLGIWVGYSLDCFPAHGLESVMLTKLLAEIHTQTGPRSATRFNFYSFRIVDSWNYLPEDIINAPTLNTFKARLDKCWSGRNSKFICTKLDTKQLKLQNKDYLEGKESTRPKVLMPTHSRHQVMLCYDTVLR